MKTEFKITELTTVGDTRKSFYGKALLKENSSSIELLSYTTPVAKYVKRSKNFTVTKNENYLTNTTLRHINAFRVFLNLPKLSKKQILSL